ncbi:hypothetical protein A6R68_01240, partial [Neotoma lepida]
MSDPAQDTLQQQAVQWLLKDEALAISALEYLPTDFFPPLFKEAFTGRQTNLVRAMVAAWPFHCLPMGTLMPISHMETLKAVLDALDFLLTQKVRPRRWKLQVLDLQKAYQDSWDGQAGGIDVSYTPQVLSQKQTMEHDPEHEVKQPLRVLVDIGLSGECLKETDKYLLKWARLRKGSVQLCCRELKIGASHVYTVIEILNILDRDCVQDLELNSWWQQGNHAWFAHCLGQLGNLCKLPLLGICQTLFSGNSAPPDMKNCVTEPVPQFPNQDCLEHLYMNDIYFLKGNLETLLRCLKTPLETLSITHSQLSQADLNHLPLSLNLHQLTHLNLSSVVLSCLSTGPLHSLLKKVAATLKILELEGCRMKVSQLSALLPVLSQCTQLIKINLRDNDISMTVLQDLFHHTANLSQLILELYPAPLECYDDMGHVLKDRFAQHCSELMDILRAIRQPKYVCFAVSTCFMFLLTEIFISMSINKTPALLQLTGQSLLRNQALAISALEDLPVNFFPSLFKQAFDGRHMEILKAMVAAWPFSCLPVGALMKTPDVEALQAVLDGVDMLQSQKVPPRRWKLRVLDLRNVHQDFWDVWTGTQEGARSSEPGSEMQVGKSLPRYALRRRLKVVTDLSLRFHLKEHQTRLLQWAQQRKGSVRLCCLKMNICAFPVETVKEVLDIFPPDYIEELELFTNQALSFLGHFAPCLGRMRNLRKFHLTHIYLNTHRDVSTLTDTEEKCVTKFLSHFSKLNCLQSLSLDGVYFSSHHMKQLFRCLKTPLESLRITLRQLSQSDLKHLSQCQRLCQLKHLNLSGVVLSELRPTHLRVLLENVAVTLQHLELKHCRIKDSQLSTLLPALSQCSQLTRASFYDNDFSVAVLKDLLQTMANLSKLTVELYPAPLECYDPMNCVLVEKFAQLCPELLDILTAKRQPKTIAFVTRICLECCRRCVYDTESRL